MGRTRRGWRRRADHPRHTRRAIRGAERRRDGLGARHQERRDAERRDEKRHVTGEVDDRSGTSGRWNVSCIGSHLSGKLQRGRLDVRRVAARARASGSDGPWSGPSASHAAIWRSCGRIIGRAPRWRSGCQVRARAPRASRGSRSGDGRRRSRPGSPGPRRPRDRSCRRSASARGRHGGRSSGEGRLGRAHRGRRAGRRHRVVPACRSVRWRRRDASASQRRCWSAQARTSSRFIQASKAIGVAQTPQVTPGSDERVLDRIFRRIPVAEDAPRDRVQAVVCGGREGIEGLVVAPLCAFDEFGRQPDPLDPVRRSAALTH